MSAETFLEYELLFTADREEAGWWSPSAHNMVGPTKAADRPDGLRHLFTVTELNEASAQNGLGQ